MKYLIIIIILTSCKKEKICWKVSIGDPPTQQLPGCYDRPQRMYDSKGNIIPSKWVAY